MFSIRMMHRIRQKEKRRRQGKKGAKLHFPRKKRELLHQWKKFANMNQDPRNSAVVCEKNVPRTIILDQLIGQPSFEKGIKFQHSKLLRHRVDQLFFFSEHL